VNIASDEVLGLPTVREIPHWHPAASRSESDSESTGPEGCCVRVAEPPQESWGQSLIEEARDLVGLASNEAITEMTFVACSADKAGRLFQLPMGENTFENISLGKAGY
jgi:hypothetical protein